VSKGIARGHSPNDKRDIAVIGCGGRGAGDLSAVAETVLLGLVALRAGRKIEWDGEKMHVKNYPQADQFLRRHYRKGWEVSVATYPRRLGGDG